MKLLLFILLLLLLLFLTIEEAISFRLNKGYFKMTHVGFFFLFLWGTACVSVSKNYLKLELDFLSLQHLNFVPR